VAGQSKQQGVVADVRDGCAWVAQRSRSVRIETELVSLYAASLPPAELIETTGPRDRDERELRAAYWLTLDAINFGSGWFPTLRKRPGRTGYTTIADGLRRRFDRRGAWTAAQLRELTAAELAHAMRQDPGHELMGLFAWSLNDLGAHLLDDHDGSFVAVVESAGESATALVETLAAWDCFADASSYDGRAIPFLKRAQIAAADLSRAGVGDFDDVGELTMFADNLVPHVLRLDGLLTFDPELVARIDAEELIEHGSREEIEIRACAVHAVEQIVAAAPVPTTAAAVDQLVWHRGQERPYKARPRHRSRSTAY
jgi:hypothetical protein